MNKLLFESDRSIFSYLLDAVKRNTSRKSSSPDVVERLGWVAFLLYILSADRYNRFQNILLRFLKM